ncbi:MAG: peptidase T [Planctomycetota bacterium]
MRAFNSPAEILETTRVVEHFLDSVKYDTQSNENCAECPSTAKQLELGRHLVGVLREIGLEDVSMDENGYVLAELPGTEKGAVGFCAHLDTSPAFSGKNVQPRLHQDYDGTPIQLENHVVIDPADCPELLECRGDTIITSDGTTLLGADDKAGIAAILGLLEKLRSDASLKYPTIRICFNPDEEIGRGSHEFPMERFNVPVAFTVDGSFPGEINVETFSADKAVVTFQGVAVHPGTAKGRMVNALTYMGKFLARLPMAESPECTEKREGFFHPTDCAGDAAQCTVSVIIRDFDSAVVEQRGKRLSTMAESLTAEEPGLRVTVELQQQYRNMYEQLSQRPEISRNLTRAVQASGLAVRNEPVRGGTDGSQLTAKGLPTPNIFAGGVNFHGPREWISTRALALSTCTLLNLVQIHAEES